METRMNYFDAYKEFGNEVIVDKKLKIVKMKKTRDSLTWLYEKFISKEWLDDPCCLDSIEHVKNNPREIVSSFEGYCYNHNKIENSIHSIENFCHKLVYYEKERYFEELTGLFLSTLTNYISNFRLKDNNEINFDFFNLTKKIDYVGFQMKKGTLRIEGNVGNNFANYAGGATIILNGDAGTEVGYGACAQSRIFLRGNFVSIGDYISGAEIYHKRKRIWPR